MNKIIIIEPNTNDKDQVKAYMVKGEAGDDGISPVISATREGTTTTITFEDAEGTKTADIYDGVSPTISSSKIGKVTTLTIEDASGTHTATINDGEDGATTNIIDSDTLTDNTSQTYSGRIIDEKETAQNEQYIPNDSFLNTRLGNNVLTNYSGASGTVQGHYNVGVGNRALEDNTTGSYNTAVGAYSLRKNTTGKGATAVGGDALKNNTTGNNNVAVGNYALEKNTTGSYNIAIGTQGMNENTTGEYNTSVGDQALFENTTGSYNTAVGKSAGRNATGYSNTSCFGYDSKVTGDNQVQLGDSHTSVYAYSTLNVRSDERDKKDIEDIDLGLDFIKKLRPVKYKWKFRNDGYEGHRYHEGLIAQEVKEVMDELEVDFGGYQDHKVNGGEDVLTLGYGEFIAPLIKAIQEQQKMIEELQNQVEKLSSKK